MRSLGSENTTGLLSWDRVLGITGIAFPCTTVHQEDMEKNLAGQAISPTLFRIDSFTVLLEDFYLPSLPLVHC